MNASAAFRIRSIATTLLALSAFGFAACGEATQDTMTDDTRSQHDERDGSEVPELASDGDRPPRPPWVRVSYGTESVDLRPWTFCYGAGCADGLPPRNPPDVGTPSQVVVEYALEDWTFEASFQPVGQHCEFPAKLEEIGPGRFLLRPAGPAGEYDVTLFGRGPRGDTSVTFRWTTPSDGTLPAPGQSDDPDACRLTR
jgi:hypothetical protein